MSERESKLSLLAKMALNNSTLNDAHDLSANGTMQNGSTTKLYGANPPPAWSHRKSIFHTDFLIP